MFFISTMRAVINAKMSSNCVNTVPVDYILPYIIEPTPPTPQLISQPQCIFFSYVQLFSTDMYKCVHDSLISMVPGHLAAPSALPVKVDRGL